MEDCPVVAARRQVRRRFAHPDTIGRRSAVSNTFRRGSG
jgi:hypothetical protein